MSLDNAARGLALAVKALLSGPLTTALRQVATGCTIPTYRDASVAAFMSASVHYAGDHISAIAVETPWFYINTGGGFVEAAPGSTATLAAWIEYPRGTFTQLTYAGATTGTLPDGGRLLSDLVTLPTRIPRNAQFRVWQRVIGAGAGRVLNVAGNVNSYANGGEATMFTATGSTVPPVGMTTNTNSTTTFRPCAILANTTRRSFLVKADSRGFGNNDARSGGFPDTGEICRSLGNFRPFPVPYISVSAPGDSLLAFIAASSTRANTIALAAYCTDVVIQLGYNDAKGGSNLASIQTNTATVKGYFGSKNFWLTTKPPGSTGAWTATDFSDQTTIASNAVRVTVNNWIRGYPSGYVGFFEIADAVESARDSGKWKAPGWTTDGEHASPTAYEFIRDNGFVNVAGVL